MGCIALLLFCIATVACGRLDGVYWGLCMSGGETDDEQR